MATDATSAIVGSMIVIMGTTEIADIKRDGFHAKPIIVGFMLGTALLIIAVFNPEIAKAFAYLGVVGALVTNGPDAFKAIGAIS